VGLAFCVYVYGAVAGGEPSEVTEASQRSIFCSSVVSGMLADRKSASRIQLQEIGPIRLEQCVELLLATLCVGGCTPLLAVIEGVRATPTVSRPIVSAMIVRTNLIVTVSVLAEWKRRFVY
jgi:hypothetical protein